MNWLVNLLELDLADHKSPAQAKMPSHYFHKQSRATARMQGEGLLGLQYG